MVELRRTAEFIDWLDALRDVQARARIAKRIDPSGRETSATARLWATE